MLIIISRVILYLLLSLLYILARRLGEVIVLFFGSSTPIPLLEVIANITAKYTAATKCVKADPQVGRLSPPLYRRLGFF